MLEMQLIGYVGKDAVTKQMNDKIVVSFSVGVSVGKDKETQWIECNWWVTKDSLSQYIKKGSHVFVRGLPKARSYVNKENVTVNVQECMVDKFSFVGAKPKEQSGTQSNNPYPQAETQPTPAYSNVPKDDDLPF